MVSYLGPEDGEYYECVRKRLRDRFAPEGNETEWQQHLQSRLLDHREALEDFAGELRRLAEKAYPADLDSGQRESKFDTLRRQWPNYKCGQEGVVPRIGALSAGRVGKGTLKETVQERKQQGISQIQWCLNP
ncbi:hypothetical protein EMCRGX_G025123 [Ephydatia muelleri]